MATLFENLRLLSEGDKMNFELVEKIVEELYTKKGIEVDDYNHSLANGVFNFTCLIMVDKSEEAEFIVNEIEKVIAESGYDDIIDSEFYKEIIDPADPFNWYRVNITATN